MYSFVYVLMRLTSLALERHFYQHINKRIFFWPPFMHLVYIRQNKTLNWLKIFKTRENYSLNERPLHNMCIVGIVMSMTL